MIKAIIVDDESAARNILEKLLGFNHPEIHVVDKCESLLDAVASIEKNEPDVVFLDIEMPKHAGYEILKFLDKIDFEIIFITAFNSYAMKAFEVAALDYIMKPIEEERLSESIERLQKRVNDKETLQKVQLLEESIRTSRITKITVFHKGSRNIIELDQIIAVEAAQAYCKFHVLNTSEVFILSKNLKQVEEFLEGNDAFFRSHKSWIINLKYVSSYIKSKNLIRMESGVTAKLSRYRLDQFQTKLTTS